MVVRFSKLLMVTGLAAFALIVTFDNITDYDTNFQFVRHVLSMDTTFAGNALMYRSIGQPALWSVAYILIVAAEGICGAMLVAGAMAMLRNLRARLLTNRLDWPLFDTPRLTRNLERAYRAMWEDLAAGRSPRPIKLTEAVDEPNGSSR